MASSRGPVRKLFTSVVALEGARKRDSSSSSFLIFRVRRSSDVFRPSRGGPSRGGSSGSSVPPLLDLRCNDDFLPAWGASSGSSVAVRRIRAKRRDDFRPAVDSSGVAGAVA